MNLQIKHTSTDQCPNYHPTNKTTAERDCIRPSMSIMVARLIRAKNTILWKVET